MMLFLFFIHTILNSYFMRNFLWTNGDRTYSAPSADELTKKAQDSFLDDETLNALRIDVTQGEFFPLFVRGF